MDSAPKNTVGTPIEGGPTAEPLGQGNDSSASTPLREASQPSEVAHPHTRSADHLTPLNPNPRPMGEPAGAEGAGRLSEPPRPEKPSGTPPRTGIGRGQ